MKASEQISVRFPSDQMAAIQRHAREAGMTVTQFIRKSVLANLFTPSSADMPPLQGFYRDEIKHTRHSREVG